MLSPISKTVEKIFIMVMEVKFLINFLFFFVNPNYTTILNYVGMSGILKLDIIKEGVRLSSNRHNLIMNQRSKHFIRTYCKFQINY